MRYDHRQAKRFLGGILGGDDMCFVSKHVCVNIFWHCYYTRPRLRAGIIDIVDVCVFGFDHMVL